MERKTLSSILQHFNKVDCGISGSVVYNIKDGYLAKFNGNLIIAFEMSDTAKPNRLYVQFERHKEYNRINYAQLQDIEIFQLIKVY